MADHLPSLLNHGRNSKYGLRLKYDSMEFVKIPIVPPLAQRQREGGQAVGSSVVRSSSASTKEERVILFCCAPGPRQRREECPCLMDPEGQSMW